MSPLATAKLTFSLIRIHGEASQQFLQGQLTCDMTQVTKQRSHLAAYCNVKGRVLATLRVWGGEGTYWLLMPTPIAATVLAAFNKYAIFSRISCQLEMAYQVHGFWGVESEAALTEFLGLAQAGDPAGRRPFTAPSTAADANSTASLQEVMQPANDAQTLQPKTSEEDSSSLLQDNRVWTIADAGADCGWLLAHGIDAALPQFLAIILPQHPLAKAQPPDWTAVAETHWQLQQIKAGWVDILPETQELFLPQMLNLQKFAAVSFSKGCYLGQEAIARVTFKGRIKRHLYGFSINSSDILPRIAVGADLVVINTNKAHITSMGPEKNQFPPSCSTEPVETVESESKAPLKSNGLVESNGLGIDSRPLGDAMVMGTVVALYYVSPQSCLGLAVIEDRATQEKNLLLCGVPITITVSHFS